MKKQQTSMIVSSLALLLALSGCGPSLLSTELIPVNPAVSAAPAANVATPAATSIEPLAALEGALQNIYTKVNPSVVSIQVVQQEELSTQAFPEMPGFRFFFEPPIPQLPQQQEPENRYSYGAGSGFVWDKEGHIVTNNHVVAGADKIRVTFADGSTATGEVIGADPDSDLAVVKVDVPAERLQPVEVTDSTQVQVGQLAVAIGNPFALENTMTVGFVSALGRQLPVGTEAETGLLQGPSYTIPDIIQTDAPINPGNSGGVLVNDQGQVIGVTAAIESPVRASAGIGFAIPSAIVQKVVPALIKEGSFEHPWLGLSGTSLNPDLAEAMTLKAEQRGALVIDVTPGSPADEAGLRGSDRQVEIDGQQVRVGGDVITAIDGQPVQEFDDIVAYLVRSTEVDQTVQLTVLRDGQEETISVKLAARPNKDNSLDLTQGQVAGQTWLGIRGTTITPEIAEALDLPAGQEGILVEQVELNSPADQASLQGGYKPTIISGRPLALGGDIITAIDNQPVSSMEDLQTFLQQAEPGQKVTLTLLRDGKQVEAPVTLSERSGS